MKNLFTFFVALLAISYSYAQNSNTSTINKLNPMHNMPSIADYKNEVITALFDVGIDTSVIDKNVFWVNPNEILDCY